MAFAEIAGGELAAKLAPYDPEIVVSVATMGIPIAIEVTRALGLDDYVILHKTPKIHLADAIAEPVRSITTAAAQRLLFDRARLDAVVGRRVAVVDDVISTGGSTKAALNLMRRVGAEPVVVGAVVTEGAQWRSYLGEDAALVRALGAIPLFRHGHDGALGRGLGGPRRLHHRRSRLDDPARGVGRSTSVVRPPGTDGARWPLAAASCWAPGSGSPSTLRVH